MALRIVKGSLDRMFDKNLQDLVRGIRNHKDDEPKYVAQCIDEVKQELKQDNIAVKANAIAKLNYLQMLGYDIGWAAFNTIEVMSSPKFAHKRTGYLAAAQSFHEGTDVLMLTTNLIRKDLNSQNQFEAGLALTGVACFLTSDLARDLANDVMTLMASSRPYVRKKAVLLMYKIFLRYPDSLRPAFPRLKDKLEDPDTGVQSAAVNVICELARRNPKNYLSLAPLFFKLMTSSTNNWVLIKIIKLFGALTPLEPRLGKKLIEPLTNLIHSTSAMSLLYECVNTVIAGMPDHSASIQLCVQKLRILIEDSDQNLKYLGLLAMSRILRTHPRSVQAHKDLVLQCLDDKDESIRLRSLDLLYGMVSKKNLMEIVRKLMVHMDKAEGTAYRDELLTKIIDICSQSNYQHVTNFEWYVSVLVELTRAEGTRHGKIIAAQLLDVAIRVRAVRPFAVMQMAQLLQDGPQLASCAQRNGMSDVLYAAAWICGEFAQHLQDSRRALEALLQPRACSLPSTTQAVYLHNSLKLYAGLLLRSNGCSEEKDADQLPDTPPAEEMADPSQLMLDRLSAFLQSGNLEVQERASCALQLVRYVQKLRAREPSIVNEVHSLFLGELNPVAPKAQRKVPIPEGLDLDAWINEPLGESSSEEEAESTWPCQSLAGSDTRSTMTLRVEPKPEEIAKMREIRKKEQENNPYYIKSSPSRRKDPLPGVDHIPVVQIDLTVPLKVPGLPKSDQYIKLEEERRRKQHEEKKKKAVKRKEKDRRHGRRRKEAPHSESDEDIAPVHTVDILTEEMPENALPSDEEDKSFDPNDPYKALDIDLDMPVEKPAPSVKKPEQLGETQKNVLPEELVKVSKKVKKEKKDKEKKKKVKVKKSKGKSWETRAPVLREESVKEEEEEDEVMEELVEGTVGNGIMAAQSMTSPTLDGEDPPQAKEVDLDDLSFWLSASDAPQPSKSKYEPILGTPKQESPEAERLYAENKVQKASKQKKEKKSKEKGDKKSHEKKKKRKKSEGDEAVQAVQNGGLESEPLQALSPYKLLTQNDDLRLTYGVHCSTANTDHVTVSVVIENNSVGLLKSMDFEVLDSLNMRLVRGAGELSSAAVSVPFQLPPGVSNEAHFTFTVQSIVMPQKLKGTMSYIVKLEEESRQEKIDFTLLFSCSSYLLSTHLNSDDFGTLLAEEELATSSVRTGTGDVTFPQVLSRLCSFHHLTVVERMASCSSLYAKSIQGHHICLLVKLLDDKVVSIEGKAVDRTLLTNVLEEVKQTLAAP
uniref:AP-3 complex subunit delta-1 isoform X2 n=1 Tax=Myxine glutinosa TaxID=7769 RepID=UPI00358E5B4D